MNNTKAWYESKTIWGAVLAAICSLLQFGGIHVPTATQAELAEALVALAGAIVGLVAVYGRMNAEKLLR